MKTVHFLAAAIFAASAALCRADAPHDNTSFLQLFTTPPPDVLLDAETTPVSFLPAEPEITPAVEAAVAEAKRKEADNKNWMLEGYEQQLQARRPTDEAPDPSANTNLYAELSADKDLAKAAGLRPLDFTAPTDVNPLTGEGEKKTALGLRDDPTLDPLASADAKNAPFFKPMVIPLDSPAATRVEAPYALPSPISASFSAPISFDLAPQATAEDDAAQNAAPADPGAMDIPGMTAAESTPAMREALDLPDDEGPGVLSAEEKDRHNLALELPQPPDATNADRLEKLQNAALALPGQPLIKKAPQAIEPFALKPTITPIPVMVPDPPPLRRQLADPYDILR